MGRNRLSDRDREQDRWDASGLFLRHNYVATRLRIVRFAMQMIVFSQLVNKAAPFLGHRSKRMAGLPRIDQERKGFFDFRADRGVIFCVAHQKIGVAVVRLLARGDAQGLGEFAVALILDAFVSTFQHTIFLVFFPEFETLREQ